jgi:protein N-lysine methyltransferase METTL21D
VVHINQKPHALSGKKLGVGACLWDGAITLAGFIGRMPRHKFVGLKVVELGAGVGLVGLLAARYGAHVTLTDLEKVRDEGEGARGPAAATGGRRKVTPELQ